MRKKLIFLSALFTLCFSSVFAQEETAVPRRVNWGIKANLNVEIPGKWRVNKESIKMFNTGFGASLGGVCNIYLGKNTYLEPGASLFYEGYSYSDIFETAPSGLTLPVRVPLYKVGVRIPVVVGYEFNISENFGLYFFTGPQISYAFAGKVSYKNLQEGNRDLDENVFNPEGQRRFDCSWKVGIGFPTNNFIISLDADIGITDLQKTKASFRENRIGLGIAYYFLQ